MQLGDVPLLTKGLPLSAYRLGARTKDLPADDLQAVDFQVLNGGVARDQGHAKSLGVGRNHDVKCSCTRTEALGTDTNPGMRLSGLFIPRMNRYPREEGAYGRHDRRVVLSKARAIEQLCHGDA